MPRVPVLEGPRVQQRPVGTPYSNLNHDTGGREVAQGLAQLGAGFAAVEEARARAAQRANAVAANDGLTQFQHEGTSELVGDSAETAPQTGEYVPGKWGVDLTQPAEPKAREGFLASKGKAAAERSAETLQRLGKRRQEIAEGLANDAQRRIFLRDSAKMYEGFRGRVEGHVAQEREQAEKLSLQAAQAEGLRDIANNFADDKGAADTAARVESAIRAIASNYGDDVANAEAAAWRAKVASTRLNQYLAAKDWRGAEGLFAQVKEQLGPQAVQFQHSIELLKEKREGEDLALALVEDARGPGGFILEDKVLADFEATVPPEQRTDAMERAIHHRIAVEREKKNAALSGLFDSALTSYLDRHNLNDVDSNVEAFLRQHNPKGWHQLEQMAKSDAAGARNQPPTAAQVAALGDLQVDMADNPETYATMPPAEFRAKWFWRLHPSDRERAQGGLAQLHGQAAKPKDLSPLETKLLLQKGREAGIFDAKQNDVSKWNEDAAQLFYRGAQELSGKAAEYRKANGKAPPLEQVEEWANEMMLKGKVPGSGWLWDTSTTRLEAEVKETPFEPKWSSEERRKAREALERAGAPADEAAVDALLRRKHGLQAAPSKATPPPEPEAPRLKPTGTPEPVHFSAEPKL